MERTKHSNSQMENGTLVRVKKVRGGAIRFGGKLYKPNEITTIDWNLIPVAFRPYFDILDGNSGTLSPASKFQRLKEGSKEKETTTQETAFNPPPPSPVESGYKIEPAGGVGWFNIVDSDGKKINESAMRKLKAEEVLKQLVGE